MYKLDPIIQDGILRVGGRLGKAAMPEEAKHPAILHKHSRVASLILQHIHKRIGHCGRNYVLAQLRQKYWIPQANSSIRKIISKCTTCRRYNAKVGEQKMADLPEDRLAPNQPPFTNVGVDYFGPFLVKRGRSLVKRYGVIFTCLTTRAAHIEIAHSLDTDSCIQAILQFTDRRGQVKIMRSDNGTNFVGAERELRETIKKISYAMMQEQIKWIFNPLSASHQGGVWERQIRSIRKILNSTLNQQTLDDENLPTMMCKVESILNNRPLTKTSDDPNDLEPLTPNHLLLLKTKPEIPPKFVSENEPYPRRCWK
ncbi:uncharacterized protein LOC127528851 isoform X1 [Erpetoichthys calabaricus]|uniref:uncharacterized protein LOC127528851 isoform X1 n=1 Tax=Erpetoichthys calabaricus TaxID=27687 RepID=UPI0022346077|nr:uncharacterized protein LOC127528851 isoform X1 [Erpetoichthys calabaricus]